jgi:hypothetical protein
MVTESALSGLEDMIPTILAGGIRGRVVVNLLES